VDGYRVDVVSSLFEVPVDDRPDGEDFPQTNLPETYDMVVQWRRVMDEESQVDQQAK
jgi:hypothetical protein